MIGDSETEWAVETSPSAEPNRDRPLWLNKAGVLKRANKRHQEAPSKPWCPDTLRVRADDITSLSGDRLSGMMEPLLCSLLINFVTFLTEQQRKFLVH